MHCWAARVWFGGWSAWVRPKGIEVDLVGALNICWVRDWMD